jgi:hypothetical protein
LSTTGNNVPKETKIDIKITITSVAEDLVVTAILKGRVFKVLA